jgi:hypothetical protein
VAGHCTRAMVPTTLSNGHLLLAPEDHASVLHPAGRGRVTLATRSAVGGCWERRSNFGSSAIRVARGVQVAASKHCLSRAKPARPYIVRLSILSRPICPSTGLVDHCVAIAPCTAGVAPQARRELRQRRHARFVEPAIEALGRLPPQQGREPLGQVDGSRQRRHVRPHSLHEAPIVIAKRAGIGLQQPRRPVHRRRSPARSRACSSVEGVGTGAATPHRPVAHDAWPHTGAEAVESRASAAALRQPSCQRCSR